MSEFLLVEPIGFRLVGETVPLVANGVSAGNGHAAISADSEVPPPHSLAALQCWLERSAVLYQGRNVVDKVDHGAVGEYGEWEGQRGIPYGRSGVPSPAPVPVRSAALLRLAEVEQCVREVIAMDAAHSFVKRVLLPFQAVREHQLQERERQLLQKQLIIDYQLRRLVGETDAGAMAVIRERVETLMPAAPRRTTLSHWLEEEPNLGCREGALRELPQPSLSPGVTKCRLELANVVGADLGVSGALYADEATFLRQVIRALEARLVEMVRCPPQPSSTAYVAEKVTHHTPTSHVGLLSSGDLGGEQARRSRTALPIRGVVGSPPLDAWSDTEYAFGLPTEAGAARCKEGAGAAGQMGRPVSSFMGFQNLQRRCEQLERELAAAKERPTPAAGDDGHSTANFDPLTSVLFRLEETRAESYLLEQEVEQLAMELDRLRGGGGRAGTGTRMIKAGSSRWEADPVAFTLQERHSQRGSITSALLGYVRAPHAGGVKGKLQRVQIEAFGLEEASMAIEQHRYFLWRLRRELGISAVALRLVAESRAAQFLDKPHSVFVSHSVSLHQFTDTSGNVLRRVAILYPMPPARQGELPEDQLVRVLHQRGGTTGRGLGCPLQVFDLRERYQAARTYFEGSKHIQLSYNGRYAYIRADSRAEREVAELLCSKECLNIAPKDRFFYQVVQRARQSVAASQRDSVGDAHRSFLPMSWLSSFRGRVSTSTVGGDDTSGEQAAVEIGEIGWVGDGVCAWGVNYMKFTSAEEEKRFALHVQSEYSQVLELSDEEVEHFAGACVEVTARTSAHTVRRVLLVSQQAMEHLSAVHKKALAQWYEGESNLIVVNVTLLEQRTGYSLKSMVASVAMHGMPPLQSSDSFLRYLGLEV